MAESILTTTKRTLGLAEDYTAFDVDVIMHINSALSNLNQIGIGPTQGFKIEDASKTWDDFMGVDPRYSDAQSYVYLFVRLLFDPPTLGYVLTAWKEMMNELVWRLNVQREEIVYPPEIVPVDDEDLLIIDGGGP